MWHRACFGIFISAVILLAACGEPNGDPAPPSALRFGVLPDQNVEQIRTNYIPLFEYLSRETGLPYEFVPVDT